MALIVLVAFDAALVDGWEGPLRSCEGGVGMWGQDVVGMSSFRKVPTLANNSDLIRWKKSGKALTVLPPVRVWLQEVKTKRTLGLDMVDLG